MEENDKLKSHYDILKEHELNIILDCEGKKSKEISFYEQKMADLHKQAKDEIIRAKELEELVFKLKEEVRKLDFEN